ncbi:GNAT family N-acetyltransferase [Aquimarina sediminis]|uniref:GNAT family N-acetyltransferase n=1 Tax=Aquimarina sediminis TaxID=2070536 RepID=UPI000CA04FBD|nr:GNAT family N-acetyltransferase [Aquimarina sediminis]
MKISKSTLEDVNDIFLLYDMAIAYQNKKNAVAWPKLQKELIEIEVEEGRQYKLTVNNEIACIWVYTFNDPEIWEDKSKDPAIYIHRIASNPKFRGQNLVTEVFKWTIAYAQEHNLKYIRLDTVGDNQGLINLYTRNGFDYLGTTMIKDPSNLPLHYHNNEVCLFEMNV